METEATQISSSSAAGAYPRWVILEPSGERESEDSISSADARTMAASRTTIGDPIRVSFSLETPPALSRLHFDLPNRIQSRPHVIAAHRDSILIQVGIDETWKNYLVDYFVYNAGAAAAADPPRPPSLSLLPPYYLAAQEGVDGYSSRPGGPMQRHHLDSRTTGLLRRGEDGLVVAKLKMEESESNTPMQKVAEILLFRSGEWRVKRAPIRFFSHDDGQCGELPSLWTTNTVVPVGDQLLCWVDLSHGLMFSNVFDESPVLRYVPLPVEPIISRKGPRNVCVTAGDAVKFADIFPRCCCGGAGATECRRSHHAYTINTWTLKMDDMAWVMDGMVDATEIWAMDAYNGLPRIQPYYPVVSMDEPHAICLVVCERYHVNRGDETVWLIMVDMMSKTLRSVTRYPEGRHIRRGANHIPSRASRYLNSYPSSGDTSSSSNHTSSPSISHMNMDRTPPMVIDDLPTNNASRHSMQSFSKSSSEAMQVSAILVVLEEIPGFARADMLKAYSILSHDNGRRLKSLLGLPMNLRKDWLLMEIKASEACFFCSVCAEDLQHA